MTSSSTATAVVPGVGMVPLSSAAGRWILAVAVLGSGISFLDATVVNVAMPAIGRDFGVGLESLQWTSTAYTLTLSAFLLLGGALGDRYGRRRIFVAGLVWFAGASLLCALATSAALLISARALQGIGGALLTPGSLAIIEATFREEDRGRAIGAWSGLTGVFGALGPLLGGLLVGAVSWRLVFFLNVPLTVAALLIASRRLPESSSGARRGALDVRGPLLAVLGLAGITYALIEGPVRGWTGGGQLLPLGAGCLALAAFFANERRESDPLLPLDIFRSRDFAGANLTTFVVYAALGAVTFLLVLELQQVLHYSPLQAGASLLPLTLVLLALSSRSGRLAAAIGPRVPLTVGPVLAGAGMALFARVDAGASYAAGVLPGAIVFGLGMVLTVPALTTTALGAVGPERAGIASAVNNDVARLASLAAVAVVPALAGISTRGSAVDARGFSCGFHTAMLLCAGLCATGGVISLAALRPRPRTRQRLEPPSYCCPLTGPPNSPEAARAEPVPAGAPGVHPGR